MTHSFSICVRQSEVVPSELIWGSGQVILVPSVCRMCVEYSSRIVRLQSDMTRHATVDSMVRQNHLIQQTIVEEWNVSLVVMSERSLGSK